MAHLYTELTLAFSQQHLRFGFLYPRFKKNRHDRQMDGFQLTDEGMFRPENHYTLTPNFPLIT